MAAIGITPCGTMIAEDIRDLQNGAGMRRRYAGGPSGRMSRSSGLMTSRMVLVATRV